MRCYIRCQRGREDLVTPISDFQDGCCAFTPCTTNFVASEPIIFSWANKPRIGVACKKLIWIHYAVKESKFVTNLLFLFSKPIYELTLCLIETLEMLKFLGHQNIKKKSSQSFYSFQNRVILIYSSAIIYDKKIMVQYFYNWVKTQSWPVLEHLSDKSNNLDEEYCMKN